MRKVLVCLALVLFLLTACDRENGKGMLGISNNSQAREDTAITGQIIGDIYSKTGCLTDSDCGPSQACVNESCVVKQPS